MIDKPTRRLTTAGSGMFTQSGDRAARLWEAGG